MRYAFVTTNLLDMKAEPEFHAERVNQMLFGEVVRCGESRKGYVLVTQADGYTGWSDRRFLRRVSAKRAEGYLNRINVLVSRPQLNLRGAGSSSGPEPHFVYYGTRLERAYHRGLLATCRLPDDTKVVMSADSLKMIRELKRAGTTGSMIVREARRFLGVPYLWGGVSPAGFDCSGFVRAVYGRFGIDLPRDTKDQINTGEEIDRNDIKRGDLLFFRRHVGIALGNDRLIHASAGGSGVRINSLRSDDEDYRPDLRKDYATARRVL